MAKKAKKATASKKAARSSKPFSGRKSKGRGQTTGTRQRSAPRQRILPGAEGVRSAVLDHICEEIGDARAMINKGRALEADAVRDGLDEMTRMMRNGGGAYRHAKIELALVPGAAKLRIRVTKEEGDASTSSASFPPGGKDIAGEHLADELEQAEA